MTDPRPTQPDSRDATSCPGVGMRFASVFSAVAVLGLALCLAGLNREGVSSRVAPSGPVPRIVVARDTSSLLGEWSRARLHGAVITYVTRDLGFASAHPGAIPLQVGWPVAPHDLESLYTSAATRPSLAWVAANTGIARSFTYVLTERDFAEKVAVGRASGFPGISADGSSITANNEGYLRLVSSHLPPVGDTAVLNIDASYFVDGTSAQLARDLDDSLLRYRLITLNRAEDATDVPEAARLELDRATAILRDRVAR